MKRGIYTQEEINYIKKNINKKTDDIAKKLNRSPNTIQAQKEKILEENNQSEEDKRRQINARDLYARSNKAIVGTPALSDIPVKKSKKVDHTCIFQIRQPKK